MSTEIPKLINTSHLKQFALASSGGKFERVSGEFFAEVNGLIVSLVKSHCEALPAQGKTVFGPSRRNVTWVEAPSISGATPAVEPAVEPAASETPVVAATSETPASA